MLLVSDTNIIIDLETGDLIDDLLVLEDDVGVPDVLFHDELVVATTRRPRTGKPLSRLRERGLG